MAKGRGNLIKKSLALLLLAGLSVMIIVICVLYVPRSSGNNEDNGGNEGANGGNDEDNGPKVTNEAAFDAGGASHSTKKDDGNGEGKDEYVLYSGKAEAFPKKDDWVSFEDMWENNQILIKTACKDHGWGEDNSDDETNNIKDDINSVAKASLVDHRFILAIVLQESKGCVRVQSTNNGVHNPGLMQSHNGTAYDPDNSKDSIRQMIKDGTQGTPFGKGLVQYLDKFGNAYSAARGYNSGDVAESGDLGDAIGATRCYASDVANRLTGWVKAPTKCEDGAAAATVPGGGYRLFRG